MSDPVVAAIIPAAGFSSRMGSFKPLLEIGGKTIIEHVLSLFEKNNIAPVVPVLGYQAELLTPLLAKTAARPVYNPHYENGMFSSIQIGAARLRQQCDGFFLLPVDIPLVQPATMRTLVQCFQSAPETPVFYPTCNEKRGHPPLINADLIDAILSYSGEGGMRGFLRAYNAQAQNVAVPDPNIHKDADTMDDFRHLQQTFKGQ